MNNKFKIFLVCLLLCIFINVNAFAASFTKTTDKVSVTIITDKDEVKIGDDIEVLVKFKMQNGWHIYWENPGDTGEKTKIKWSKIPNGYMSYTKSFSHPITFITDGIVQYGYDKTAYFLTSIYKIGNPLNSDRYEFSTNISWLACKDECVPEQVEIKFDIPTSQRDIFASKIWKKELEQANKTFPKKSGWDAYYEIINSHTLLINIETNGKDIPNLDGEIKFIPYKEEVIRNDVKQIFGFDGSNMSLLVQPDKDNIKDLSGVLIVGDNSFDLKPKPKLNLKTYNSHSASLLDVVQANDESILWVLLMAFVGGLILNLMPCILPILTLKTISIVQSTHNERESRIEALMYFIGVILSFMFITTILVLLRVNGEKIGWGFQMQSPIFIVIMIIIFFIIFLMLLDLVKIRTPFASVGRMSFSKKRLNSLFTGLFSVLIASPCTAPFMGIAIGYTLSKPVYIYYPIFLALAVGYALPFTLIGFFPQIMKRLLPKPGKWMIILKKIFALPILLTCVWLVWVLNSQISSSKTDEYIDDIKWETYNEQKIDALIKDDEAVFIDFTAKWCITCLANKKIALNTQTFENIIREKNIHIFRADWTSHDEEIENALRKYGRNSIPLYVYYPAHGKTYKLLPQIITPNILKEELN